MSPLLLIPRELQGATNYSLIKLALGHLIFFFENEASCETLLNSAGNAEEGNKLRPITTDCDAVDSFASWHRICFSQNQFEWKFYTLDDLKYYWAIESELTKRLSITSRQIGKKAESFFFTYLYG